MKITSDRHGFQVNIITTGQNILEEKVHKTRAAAQKRISKIVNSLDDASVEIDGFSYCEIKEWFLN